MTFKFRVCVDHNSKSGNDRRECPYFDKLQECYGYRPNIDPSYTRSNRPRDKSEKDQEITQSSSEETAGPAVMSTAPKKKSKAKAKSEEIVDVLKNLQQEMKKDQENLLQILNKHHEDRVKQEDKRLELLSTFVSNFKK